MAYAYVWQSAEAEKRNRDVGHPLHLTPFRYCVPVILFGLLKYKTKQMKKIITTFLLTAFIGYGKGQSVGIGNTTPHSTSILDLRNANAKALVLPAASNADRLALTTAPSGSVLMQTSPIGDDDPGLYYKLGSDWRRVWTNADLDKTWYKVSDEVQYTNMSRIGVGTTNPTAGVHIRAAEDGERLSVRMQGTFPSLSFEYGTAASGSYASRALIYGTTYGLMFSNSPQTPTASMRFRLGNTDRIILEPDGTFKTKSEIRLTDNDFNEKGFFQMNGNDVRIGTVSANNTGDFIVRTNGVDNLTVNAVGDVIPTNNIQFKEGAVEKTFIQRSGDNFRFGTNSGNSAGSVLMRLDGADHFKFDVNGRLTLMNDNTPTLYFQTGGVNQGYVQQQGVNLAINATGNQVRISNVIYADDGSNRVGIGTSSPEQKLHVQGAAKITSGQVLNNSNENLLPYGYAVFRGDGTKARGTASLTGGWIADDFYLSASDGSDISDGILSVTCYNARVMPSYVASGARLKISFFDEDGDQFKPAFSVVLYKTN